MVKESEIWLCGERAFSEEYERPVKETLRCLGWAATLDDDGE